MGRSRGGLTTKVHALVDARGLPIRMVLTAGQVHDSQAVPTLLEGLTPESVLIADKGYDADWIRTLIEGRATKSSPPTTSPCSSSQPSAFGYELMSPRPSILPTHD